MIKYRIEYAGQEWTRKSERVYTHAVIVRVNGQTQYRLTGFCGSEKLAQAQSRSVHSRFPLSGLAEVRVLPVSQM